MDRDERVSNREIALSHSPDQPWRSRDGDRTPDDDAAVRSTKSRGSRFSETEGNRRFDVNDQSKRNVKG